MTVDRKELKRAARQAMAGAKPAPFLVTLALLAIMLVLSVLSMSLDGTLEAMRVIYQSALEGRLVYAAPQPAGGFFGWILGIAVQVMSMELSVGFVLYALRVWRRQKAGVGDLFDSFGVFFRAIWIQLLPSLLVSLWSMLYALPVSTLLLMTGRTWWALVCLPLLAPAIMAVYSYRLAVYLMLDNPGASCWQCVAMSRQIMRGHRWEAFVLDLSFIGWALLGIIPLAGLFVLIWLAAYQQVTCAGFYERLAAAFAADNAPFPGSGPNPGPGPGSGQEPPAV